MRVRWLVAAAVAVAVCCAVAFTRGIGSDYGNIDCHFRDPYCDDAQPALAALIHGNWHEFFANQPLMGPFTLALRAPFAALAGLDHYDARLVYRLGCLACLLVLAAVALYLAAAIARRGHPAWQQWLAAALVLLNPMVFRALAVGHPEELVGSAMCVALVIAVSERHFTLAGLFLGAALTTKLWAILIVPAVLLAQADRRALMRMCAAAAAVVVLLYAPMLAGDAGRLRGAFAAANKLGTRAGAVTPANLWWFIGSQQTPFDRASEVVGGRIVTQHEVGYTLHRGVARIAHPAVVLVAALLGLLWARDPERRQRPESLLLLAALLFLIRCILDPGNSSYYHLPVVVCLAAYEGLACRRLPWVTFFVIGWLQVITWLSPHVHSDPGFGLIYLGFAVPTAIGLALWLFRPSALSAGTGVSGRRPHGAAPVAGPSTAS